MYLHTIGMGQLCICSPLHVILGSHASTDNRIGMLGTNFLPLGGDRPQQHFRVISLAYDITQKLKPHIN